MRMWGNGGAECPHWLAPTTAGAHAHGEPEEEQMPKKERRRAARGVKRRSEGEQRGRSGGGA